jgi:LacI family transcriptional regulator
MKDVAKAAGVSPSTVSHVLNNTRYVSPDLAERVWETVEKFNYQPNLLARSLRRKKTHTLGMIVPDNSNPFFAELARIIEDTCFELGYNVILCNSDQIRERERTYIDLLTEKQVDGILFVSAGDHPDHLKTVLERDVPIVIIDREIMDVECDRVLTNNYLGGQLATGHLIQRGHQRIGCITGQSTLSPTWERVRGYKDTLRDAGLPIRDEFLHPGDFQVSSGYDAMVKILAMQQPPTGIFVCNDLMAIGAMRAVSKQGLRIPEDIAVVGFDNIALASYTNPPLTTVGQRRQQAGKVATQMLIERIEDRNLPPRKYIIEPKLIIRNST